MAGRVQVWRTGTDLREMIEEIMDQAKKLLKEA